jgi:pimeloyl-ACP methyl ester carboxylesterase
MKNNERGSVVRFVSSVVVLILAILASPALAVEVADLPASGGGTQHIWYDAPAKPWAVAIMFAGGDGVIPFEADGSLKGGRSTFLRTRQLWLDQGIAVLIPGKPSSLTGVFSYRLTDAYAQDMRTLVDFARTRASAPVWLMGHSMGSVAVASAASRLTQGQLAGVVLAAPVAVHVPPNVTESVFDARLAAINVPALIIAHEQDTCRTSVSDAPARLRAALTSAPVTELILFTGGEPVGGPCDPTALHSFVGLDTDLVKRIAAWMRGRN